MGEGTFAVFGGKVRKEGGTGNRGTEGGGREGGERKEEGRIRREKGWRERGRIEGRRSRATNHGIYALVNGTPDVRSTVALKGNSSLLRSFKY